MIDYILIPPELSLKHIPNDTRKYHFPFVFLGNFSLKVNIKS